jgi:hypothetical protein
MCLKKWEMVVVSANQEIIVEIVILRKERKRSVSIGVVESRELSRQMSTEKGHM